MDFIQNFIGNYFVFASIEIAKIALKSMKWVFASISITIFAHGRFAKSNGMYEHIGLSDFVVGT